MEANTRRDQTVHSPHIRACARDLMDAWAPRSSPTVHRIPAPEIIRVLVSTWKAVICSLYALMAPVNVILPDTLVETGTDIGSTGGRTERLCRRAKRAFPRIMKHLHIAATWHVDLRIATTCAAVGRLATLYMWTRYCARCWITGCSTKNRAQNKRNHQQKRK